MQQALRRDMDRETFLRWAEGREERYELVWGQPAMMTPPARNHLRVANQLLLFLSSALRPEYEVFSLEFGVDTSAGIRCPDIVVDRAGGAGSDRTATAPVFLAEILSPSTIAVDMVEKPREYGAIASVIAYVVLSADEPRVWVWRRSETGWPPSPEMIDGMDASVELPALGIRLPLQQIYRGIGG